MLNKVRVLIVGFGFMGQTHTGNVLRNSHAQVAGIVDTVSPV